MKFISFFTDFIQKSGSAITPIFAASKSPIDRDKANPGDLKRGLSHTLNWPFESIFLINPPQFFILSCSFFKEGLWSIDKILISSLNISDMDNIALLSPTLTQIIFWYIWIIIHRVEPLELILISSSFDNFFSHSCIASLINLFLCLLILLFFTSLPLRLVEIKDSPELLLLTERLFSGIELNTWCPSNTVMKSWWGSDMLKHRPETLDIIQSLSEKIHQSSDLSFSVKSRAWLTDEDKPEQLIFLREVSHFVDFITVHGRTLKQLYAWDADFSFIKELKQSVSIPVIANGWIENYEQASNVLSQGFDGVMIWQAAIGNPWVFTNYVPSLDEKKELMIEHLCLMIACEEYFKDAVEKIDWYSIKQPLLSDLNIYKDKIDEEYPYHSLVEFRKYAFQYIKGLGNVKEKKRMLLEVKTVKSFKEILNQLGDL